MLHFQENPIKWVQTLWIPTTAPSGLQTCSLGGSLTGLKGYNLKKGDSKLVINLHLQKLLSTNKTTDKSGFPEASPLTYQRCETQHIPS